MKKILNFNSKYNVYNLLIIPVLFCAVTGYLTAIYSYNDGDSFTDLINWIPTIMGSGMGYMVGFYYPFKIIVLLINRFRKNVWEWPHSLYYWILPVLSFLFVYTVSFN